MNRKMSLSSGRPSTGTRARRPSIAGSTVFAEPIPVRETPNTRLRKFKKIRDRNLDRCRKMQNSMPDLREGKESVGTEDPCEAGFSASAFKNPDASHDNAALSSCSNLMNGRSSDEASSQRNDRVTNGVSNGVSHSHSSLPEENITYENHGFGSSVDTVEVEEVSDGELELEILPDDIRETDDDSAGYIVYDELTQSESAGSERLASDPAKPEDEYKEFGEEQEEIVIEEVKDVVITQAETIVEEAKQSEVEKKRSVEEAPQRTPAYAAPTLSERGSQVQRNPYGITARRPVRDIDDSSKSGRKRKADVSEETSGIKRRLDNSTSSGSSWSPGWRFWSVADPQTPGSEGDSMLVNVDSKSPQQSFSSPPQSDVAFTSGSPWKKYCNLM